MYMRFSPANRSAGEIRFAFSRVNAGLPTERVRLGLFRVSSYEGEAARRTWESYAVAVMGSVALPRHRVDTENTIAAILARLQELSGETWRCVNTYRVTRRRARPRRPTHHSAELGSV